MKRLSLLAAGAVLAAGCGDATGVDVDDLAGTWVATSFVFTSVDGSGQTADLIALGGSFTLTINPDSTFSFSIVEPGDVAETRTGTVVVTGATLTIAESGQGSPTDFVASRDGDALTLTTGDEDYDFDDDGVDDDATLRIDLLRQ